MEWRGASLLSGEDAAISSATACLQSMPTGQVQLPWLNPLIDGGRAVK